MADQRSAILGALVVLVALSFPGGARAAVLYDNGAPGSSGIEVTIRILAEDFVLPGPATVTGVRFWAQEDPDAWSGVIEYSLYENDGNRPAETPFAAGLGQDVEVVGDRYTFALEAPAALDGGVVYWLGLHLDDDFADSTDCCVFWTTLAPGVEVGSGAASANAGFTDNWSLTPNHHAFQLLPEPGSAALGAATLASLGLLGRRARPR